MVTTMPTFCAASAAVAAAVAPSATHLATASLERSNTLTECPAFRRLSAIGPPMFPTPTNPILAIFFSLSESGSGACVRNRHVGFSRRLLLLFVGRHDELGTGLDAVRPARGHGLHLGIE